MRFVEVRTPEQVDLQALHRIRDRLVGQRTGLMTQARAFCLEYGLAMRVGLRHNSQGAQTLAVVYLKAIKADQKVRAVV